MRTHSRATIVGICLAALGLLGFLIWGILSPKPTVPTKDGIVIGKPSGQVYVLVTKPTKKLIPVFNLASARLLLYSQSLGDEDSQVSQGVGGPGTGGPAQVVEPTVVDDNELRDEIPRDRKVGIADGPDLLPSKDQRIDNQWTVCDQYQLNQDINDPARDDKVETTVIAGVADRGPELKESESLLVRAENGDVYLVYRTPGSANLPNTNTVRAKVDLKDRVISAALRITGDEVRNITTGLLNAIPEKAPLEPPRIDGAGDQPDKQAPNGLEVGSVFSVRPAGQSPVFYVVQRDGIEEIKQTTADLIRYKQDINSGGIPELSPQDVTNSDRASDHIDDTTFPKQQTEILRPENLPVACLGWQTTGSGADRTERTSVHVGKVVPGIPRDEADHAKWVDISTPGSMGIRIDHFYMPPGRGAVVHQATSPADFNTGGIALVSDRGVKYGVPDGNTAAALGLDNQEPAPQDILRLLPDGASLDARDVAQSYDTVPIEGGQYPTESDDPNADGAQSGGN
jgi:type VII secretion protein EccB